MITFGGDLQVSTRQETKLGDRRLLRSKKGDWVWWACQYSQVLLTGTATQLSRREQEYTPLQSAPSSLYRRSSGRRMRIFQRPRMPHFDSLQSHHALKAVDSAYSHPISASSCYPPRSCRIPSCHVESSTRYRVGFWNVKSLFPGLLVVDAFSSSSVASLLFPSSSSSFSRRHSSSFLFPGTPLLLQAKPNRQ
ncbi:hypothetical protein BJX62DRAFT_52868 [Aspergillus germanicus]